MSHQNRRAISVFVASSSVGCNFRRQVFERRHFATRVAGSGVALAGFQLLQRNSWLSSNLALGATRLPSSGVPKQFQTRSSAMSGTITVVTTEDAADKAAKVAEAAATLDGASVSTETVKSYYWWDSAVQADQEWRVAVATTGGFDAAREAITNAHSYDLPMIIYDLEGDTPVEQLHWKGLLTFSDEDAAASVAKALVDRRAVACAQARPTGEMAVKTVTACRAIVEEAASPATVQWKAISGNEAYLKWLEDECKAAKVSEAVP
eukprot:TRINITY_DN5895_c0_g1_i2.p1 TRINITY_DN5895_c0_g1~~TRINITY_DN5895_c0_g1_i2.p1  ORF type:complete len:264 (-),score=51.87 TRINITY_DN5895_c0_g1_i2:45-836(-)